MTRKILYIYLGSLLVCFLAVQGCDEMLTPAQIRTVAADVQGLSAQIDSYQSATSDAIESLSADGVMSPEVADQIARISSEVDRVQPQLAAIAEAVGEAEYSDAGGLTTVIEALQAGNKASAPFNPYSILIELGLGGAAAVAALLARKNANEASQFKAKYQAHKQGTERTRIELQATNETGAREAGAQLYRNIGEARAALGVS